MKLTAFMAPVKSMLTWQVAGIVAIALLTGLILPGYVSAMENNVARAMALPVVLLLGLLLLYSRMLLLLLILLVRSSGDIFFESTRFALGSVQIGVGGLINIFVILIALLLVAEKPGLLPKKLASMWAPFLLVALISVAIAPVKSDAIRAYIGQISYFAMFIFSTRPLNLIFLSACLARTPLTHLA